jgi:murein DD-endopeptidase MepM/ murein hydrolase activator NlpD
MRKNLLTKNHVRVLTFIVITALYFACLAPFGNIIVKAHHSFTISSGIYRIPYANGTSVTANNDHHNHPNVLNRVDLGGGDLSTIVAAASGTIRGLVDKNGDSNDLGDGLAADGITPQDDSLEHGCLDSDTVAGGCSDYNNYVWIEHPNGEWTKYTHFATGSVTANGWSVGDTILVGQALGLQSDVGSASGSHLHFEVAAIPDSAPDPPFSALGGFIEPSWNVVTFVCFGEDNGDDDNDNLYTDGETYTAGPCANTAPTADAGGPYQVNEGSAVQLDGTGSNDPENALLTYTWSPATNLDDPSSATPTYNGIDDKVDNLTLTVSDAGGDVSLGSALTDSDETTVTVLNVAPTVTATGDSINEGTAATVRATFTDPGTQDTHTASIDWNDGSAPQNVSTAQLASGVNHVYGDNGVYNVLITVTDDDGGIGTDIAALTVANLAPTVSLNTSGAVSFPGGDYLIVEAGTALSSSAQGSDPGSDDLTFTWSAGEVNTYFNNGITADLPKSSLGIFPFMASDSINALYTSVGVENISVVLEDDDAGSDSASANVIVTGTAERTQGLGWWKHQFSGAGSPQIDAATAQGYLEIVNAVSGIFSETTSVMTTADVHAVLSPTGGDRRARARAELMRAWLQFASGAIDWDSTVLLKSGVTDFLALMTASEATISNPAATNAELQAVEQNLANVRRGE